MVEGLAAAGATDGLPAARGGVLGSRRRGINGPIPGVGGMLALGAGGELGVTGGGGGGGGGLLAVTGMLMRGACDKSGAITGGTLGFGATDGLAGAAFGATLALPLLAAGGGGATERAATRGGGTLTAAAGVLRGALTTAGCGGRDTPAAGGGTLIFGARAGLTLAGGGTGMLRGLGGKGGKDVPAAAGGGGGTLIFGATRLETAGVVGLGAADFFAATGCTTSGSDAIAGNA